MAGYGWIKRQYEEFKTTKRDEAQVIKDTIDQLGKEKAIKALKIGEVTAMVALASFNPDDERVFPFIRKLVHGPSDAAQSQGLNVKANFKKHLNELINSGKDKLIIADCSHLSLSVVERKYNETKWTINVIRYLNGTINPQSKSLIKKYDHLYSKLKAKYNKENTKVGDTAIGEAAKDKGGYRSEEIIQAIKTLINERDLLKQEINKSKELNFQINTLQRENDSLKETIHKYEQTISKQDQTILSLRTERIAFKIDNDNALLSLDSKQ